jgi:hypothetical protein
MFVHLATLLLLLPRRRPWFALLDRRSISVRSNERESDPDFVCCLRSIHWPPPPEANDADRFLFPLSASDNKLQGSAGKNRYKCEVKFMTAAIRSIFLGFVTSVSYQPSWSLSIEFVFADKCFISFALSTLAVICSYTGKIQLSSFTNTNLWYVLKFLIPPCKFRHRQIELTCYRGRASGGHIRRRLASGRRSICKDIALSIFLFVSTTSPNLLPCNGGGGWRRGLVILPPYLHLLLPLLSLLSMSK